MGHVLMENHHGLVVEAELTRAAVFAERLAAVDLVAERAGPGLITVGADRAYNATDFVMELREFGATPHVAQNTAGGRSAIDRRTTRHPGYAASQRARHSIEEVFAWAKTIAGQARPSTANSTGCAGTAPSPPPPYNLIRLPKLLGGLSSRPQPGTDQPSAPPTLLATAQHGPPQPSSGHQTAEIAQFFSSLLGRSKRPCHFGIGKHTLSCREA